MNTTKPKSGLYWQDATRGAYYSPYAKLLRACVTGDAVAVEYILDRMEDGTFSDDYNIDGLTQEQVAAKDLESYDDTPLTRACVYNRPEVVETLLRRGANPNVTPPSGITALQDAIDAGSVAIVILLINYGAEIQGPCQLYGEDGDFGEVSPLEYARRFEDNDEVVQVLLDASTPKLSVIK